MIRTFESGLHLPDQIIPTLHSLVPTHMRPYRPVAVGASMLPMRGLPDFKYCDCGEVHLHNDGPGLYRVFLTLANPEGNWTLHVGGQKYVPKVGEIGIMDIGVDHQVVGKDKTKAPWISLFWEPGDYPIRKGEWASVEELAARSAGEFGKVVGGLS